MQLKRSSANIEYFVQTTNVFRFASSFVAQMIFVYDNLMIFFIIVTQTLC